MIDEEFLKDAERELGEFNASVASLKKELLPESQNQASSQSLKYYEASTEKTHERQSKPKGEPISPFDVFEIVVGILEIFSGWH